MVWWIVLGVCVGSMIVLSFVVTAALGNLSRLRRALRRVELRRPDVDKTRSKVAELPAALELLQVRLMRTSEQAAMLRAARTDRTADEAARR